MNTWMILGLFFLFALAALDVALVVFVFSEGQRFGPVAGECELLSHGVEPLIC